MQPEHHWVALTEQDDNLSVVEALLEAMNTPFQPDRAYIQSPRDLPAPEPHLPLRKASPQLLQQQSRRGAPRPLFAPTASSTHHPHHQVRGFNPPPSAPLPRVDNLTASSEHAFAGKDEKGRRPFRMPSGMRALQQEPDMRAQYAERPGTSNAHRNDSRLPSSPAMPPPSPSPSGRSMKLRSSKSLGEGLRGLKHRISSHTRAKTPNGRDTPDSTASLAPDMPSDGMRQSLRSALTSDSSLVNISSINTDHSSLVTAHSSRSDFVQVYPSWPDMDQPKGSFDVDDMIGLYEDGFESAKPSMDMQAKRSLQEARLSVAADALGKRSFHEGRPSSALAERPPSEPKRPVNMHRRSQSAGLLNHGKSTVDASLAPPTPPVDSTRSSASIIAGNFDRKADPATNIAASPSAIPRDRYGFKKISHHVTLQQYDDWYRDYSQYVERRTKKWHAMMKQYGYSTEDPIRFPAKSDKVKRYVRKGIPPAWRGAAWFWYAGGPHMLAKQPGLYAELVKQVNEGQLSDNDSEHIERDLNRTFPDNIRFKPDPTTALDAQAGAEGGGKKNRPVEPVMPIVGALRRVLQAFAVHNPGIGYCQSLNFIAGLLLVFLDSDEEKAFILLNMVTNIHLPGTHGVTLEGANIDIAVLMSCIKDSLPGIWAKLDDKGGALGGDETAQALRLPTVSLATTAWFMSLFVGTLPIESVLRVWDCLFFEGSKTLFRIALAIFKAGEKAILAVNDPMEIFQVVQTIPRGMLDVNSLMEVCFRRRGGFGHVSQDLVERRRMERRKEVKRGVANAGGGLVRLKTRFRRGTKA